MRRTTTGIFLGLMAFMISAMGLVTASPVREQGLAIQVDVNAAAIVGSWQFMGVGAPGTPPEDPMLATFSADGTVTISARAVRPALPGMPFTYVHFSTGHGTWEQGEDGSVAFTIVHLRSDETGMYRGTVTFSGTLMLDVDAQAITGNAAYTVRDPAGAVQGTIPTSLDGQRIIVEPVPAATPQA